MEEQQKYKVGDKVKLVSGGPVMAIREYLNGDMVQCDWFISGRLEQHTFKEGQLEPYIPPSYDVIAI